MDADLRFVVSSGGVAYGCPHNVAYGASVPLVSAAAAAAAGEARPSGTVSAATFDMNVRSRNGEWLCYGLRDEGDVVVAW